MKKCHRCRFFARFGRRNSSSFRQTDAMKFLNLPFAQASKSLFSNESFVLFETYLEKT